MNNQYGFSLTEALISLLLISSIAITLVQLQGQVTLYFKQALLAASQSQDLENKQELLLTSPIPYSQL